MLTIFDRDGRIIEQTELDEPPEVLDAAGQLVALLAAKGVITTKEASDLTGHSEEKLTAEVEAWARRSI